MGATEFILVLGGARSGKSTFAARLAGEHGGRVIFVATATALDQEMEQRIAKHRQERPSSWVTIEAPTHLASALEGKLLSGDVVLLDCLTLAVFNLMAEIAGNHLDDASFDATHVRRHLQTDLDALLQACRRAEATLIVVSNEVGLGLVPPYPLGRVYRDLLGFANQWLAQKAERVYLLVAGLPVEVKALVAALDKERAGN